MSASTFHVEFRRNSYELESFNINHLNFFFIITIFYFLFFPGNSAHKKKPVPMKANLSMSEMTKSPVLKKEATTPKKNRPLSSTHRAKSSSLTNIR